MAQEKSPIIESIQTAPLLIDDNRVKDEIDTLREQSLDVNNPDRVKVLNRIMRLKNDHFDHNAAMTRGAEVFEALKPAKLSLVDAAKHVGRGVMTTLNTDVVVLAKRLVKS